MHYKIYCVLKSRKGLLLLYVKPHNNILMHNADLPSKKNKKLLINFNYKYIFHICYFFITNRGCFFASLNHLELQKLKFNQFSSKFVKID